MSLFKTLTLELAKIIVDEDKESILKEMDKDFEASHFSDFRWQAEKLEIILPTSTREKFLDKYKAIYKKRALESFGFNYCNFMEAFEMNMNENQCYVKRTEIEKVIRDEIEKLIYKKLNEIELTTNV